MFKVTALVFLIICPVIFRRPVSGLAIGQGVSEQNNHQQLSKSRAFFPVYQDDNRRPIWNIAHMVNSIRELDYRLGKGANAVEADVTFNRDGTPLYTYHGPPCDCWRHCHQQEDFNEYLDYVRQIAIEESEGVGQNLILLFLDLKLESLSYKAKARAGVELANSIREHLFSHHNENSLDRALSVNEIRTKPYRELKLILSVNHVTDTELIINFLHHLERSNSSNLIPWIGFDVGMNDDLSKIEHMWKKFGNSFNIWQGDGYTNCISPFYNLERLSKALLQRDYVVGYPKKVYHWTIDLHDRIRESLNMGVDAVMTNHPERVLSVLAEPEIAHNYRLATRADDPFRKLVRRDSTRAIGAARYQRSTAPVSGGFFGNIVDVMGSLYNYLIEIPFFSLPTTSRFISRVKRHKLTTQAPVKTNQMEYRVDSASNTSEPSTSTSSTTNFTLSTTVSMSENATLSNSTNATGPELDQNQNNYRLPYEGPKWYTSALSNFLVSVMKLALPAQS